jgi:hypothetical protein
MKTYFINKVNIDTGYKLTLFHSFSYAYIVFIRVSLLVQN